MVLCDHLEGEMGREMGRRFKKEGTYAPPMTDSG